MASHLIPDDFIQKGDHHQLFDQPYYLNLADFRVHDAPHTLLGNTGATDDLGIFDGTYGTQGITLQSEDMGEAGAVVYYGRSFFTLPPEYVDASPVTVRVHCGVLTAVCDQSAAVDLNVYIDDRENAEGSDLYTGDAVSCNSTTLADKDFDLTSTDLLPGSLLDLRVALWLDDDSTAVTSGIITSVALLLNTRG